MRSDSDSYIELNELLECPYNRTIDQAKVSEIQKKIEQSGTIKPFVVTEVMTDAGKKLMIVDGHHRYLALKNMGNTNVKVPVVMASEKGIDTAKSMKEAKIVNSSGKVYTCKFLEPGLVSYEDLGQGVALLKKETIEKMLPSFIGKPVFIQHIMLDPEKKEHQKKIEEIKGGEVTEVYYNAEDGWFYAKFTLSDDAAKQRVEKGDSVSCAFTVTDSGPGGSWHNIPYDDEITDARFTHLALVENPRYEESEILVNSKAAKIIHETTQKKTDAKINSRESNTEGKLMFGLFRKKNQEKVNEKDAADEKGAEEMNAAETFLNVDGDQVSLEQLVADLEAAEPFEEVAQAENVTVNGKEYNVAKLIENYRNKKNKAAETEKPAEETKPNEKTEEEKKAEAEAAAETEKQNAKKAADAAAVQAAANAGANTAKRDLKFFTKLNGLSETGKEVTEMVVNTLSSRIDRGNERYGAKKK